MLANVSCLVLTNLLPLNAVPMIASRAYALVVWRKLAPMSERSAWTVSVQKKLWKSR